jgi:drug/metabolite transporter (DMT)-like permease
MSTITLLIVITLTTVTGDYLVKIASARPNGLTSHTFVLGALFYGLPAVGWFYMMRSHSMAFIGVAYSASTMLLLAALGVFVFRETFQLRDAVGIALAVLSVGVMTKA